MKDLPSTSDYKKILPGIIFLKNLIYFFRFSKFKKKF